MLRVSFLIDGFNLYHSAVESEKKHANYHTKWLDIKSLCESYLYAIDKDCILENVYYFSAYATFYNIIDPERVKRHKVYINALRSSGVIDTMGIFYKKTVRCPQCKTEFQKHEEKKTDVSLAVKIFEILKNEKADILVIMSGDTDFVPAIETAKRLYPQNEFIVIFPAYRWNNELKKVANRTFTIKAKRYNTYQFPQDIHFKGQILTKPSHW